MATYVERINSLNFPIDIQQGGIYQALAYAIRPEYTGSITKQLEFTGFYETAVMDWLKYNETGYAYAWIIGDYLVVVGSPRVVELPWVGATGIVGLEKYLARQEPLPIQNLAFFLDRRDTAEEDEESKPYAG